MSRARHLLSVTCRSRSLTPTARGDGGKAAARRCSLQSPILTAPSLVRTEPEALSAVRTGVRRRSDVSPVARLLRSPITPEEQQHTHRLLLGAKPRLLVTPGSPPDSPFEAPSFASRCAADGLPVRSPGGNPSAIYTRAGDGDAAARSCGKAGLKFDTPDRNEVSENGLNQHPDVPVLGRGAYGTVVLGKRKERAVAVKVVRGRCPTPGELLARRLRHPHVLSVFGVYGLSSAFSTVEMEYCGDRTLQTLLDLTTAPLDQRQVTRYVRQLASALAYIHDQGVIHLDVKPANVILTDGGDVKLADFGSARSVNDPNAKGGEIRGTVPYMAPELFQGARATCKADIYSLAISTWQLFSGESPFNSLPQDTIIYLVVARRLRPQLELASLTDRWQAVLERCWAQEPQQRPDALSVETWLLEAEEESDSG